MGGKTLQSLAPTKAGKDRTMQIDQGEISEPVMKIGLKAEEKIPPGEGPYFIEIAGKLKATISFKQGSIQIKCNNSRISSDF